MEVNGVTTYAVIDLGTQITTITYSFARQLQLEVHDLNEVIQVKGTGLHSANLWIPQFPQYEEMILVLVILDSQYTYGISIQIGAWVIWKVM